MLLHWGVEWNFKDNTFVMTDQTRFDKFINCKSNHNQLRMTRMIESLTLCDLVIGSNYAKQLHQFLLTNTDQANAISKKIWLTTINTVKDLPLYNDLNNLLHPLPENQDDMSSVFANNDEVREDAIEIEEDHKNAMAPVKSRLDNASIIVPELVAGHNQANRSSKIDPRTSSIIKDPRGSLRTE